MGNLSRNLKLPYVTYLFTLKNCLMKECDRRDAGHLQLSTAADRSRCGTRWRPIVPEPPLSRDPLSAENSCSQCLLT